MCQGVIGIINTKNNQWDWGTGSHSSLIEKVYGNNSPKFYDYLVRFECNLREGPGHFTIEGGLADGDLKALIRDKIEEKIGSPDKLVAHVKEHGWDDAFLNCLSSQGIDAFEKAHRGDEYPQLKAAMDAAQNALDDARDKAYKATLKLLKSKEKEAADKAIAAFADKVQKKLAKTKVKDRDDFDQLTYALEDIFDNCKFPDPYDFDEGGEAHDELIDATPEVSKARKVYDKALKATEACVGNDETTAFATVFLADPSNRNDKWQDPEKRLAKNQKERTRKKKLRKKKNK